MSFWSRLKSQAGGRPIPTIASATSIELDDAHNTFLISGSTAIVNIGAGGQIYPGREITLIGASGGTATITNTGATTVKGKVDLGAANANVAADDVVKLVQRNDGSWAEIVVTDN